MKAVPIALAWLALSGSAAAQQPPSTVVRIVGVVVDAQTDVALRRARIAATAASRLAPVLTDELGRFSLDISGEVTLTITKAGYAQQVVNVVSSPEATRELRVVMKRGAAIIGRVVDGLGVPALAATVIARSVPSAAPADSTPLMLTTLTDDLGEFRFGGLREGEFQVGATAGVIDARVAQAFHPDPLVGAAATGVSVRVRPGDSADVGELVVGSDPKVYSGGVVSGGVAGSEPSSRVAGHVRDSRGRPMKVVVHLTMGGSSSFMATTDPQGRYEIARVPSGSYFAEVSRPGLPATRYGQRASRQPGTPIEVRDGTTVSGIDFVLSAGAAIAGTISDEYGEPVQGATIRALQIQRLDGRSVALAVPGIPTRTSDDRGVYRLFGLLPGKYLVVADADGPPTPAEPAPRGGYAPSFYPGVTSVASALPVAIDQGDAIGVDFSFHRERTTRVVGTVVDSTGTQVRSGVLLAASQRSGSIMLEPKVATTIDGTFAFENVPAGDYVVQAVAPGHGVRPTPEPDRAATPPWAEFGMQYLTITDTEPPPLLLRTSPGALLRGRIMIDGPVSMQPMALYVWPFPTDFDRSSMIGAGPSGLTTMADGLFEIAGVTGPRRFMQTTAVDGWYLKDVRVRGVEAMDTPFDFGMNARELDGIEVVLSPAAAAISGTVTRPGGEAVGDYAVLLFSTDSLKWYRNSQAVKLERSSQNGRFRIGSLPPGSYCLVALSGTSDLITSGSWQDPALFESLRPSATRVTVAEGDVRNVTLQMPPD